MFNILQLIVAFSFIFVTNPATANILPKEVVIIVPNGPGSTIDVTARYLALKLSESTSSKFIVENKPGAGGNIAAKSLATSLPSGATLMLSSSVFVTGNHLLYKNTSVTQDDIVGIAGVNSVSFVLVTAKTRQIHSIEDLVAHIKANPNSASYGSSITTSITLAAEFLLYNNIQAVRVPYSTTAALARDLSAGVIDFIFTDMTTGLGLIQNNLATPILVTSNQRLPWLPDTPTVLEKNLPQLSLTSPIILYGPKGISNDILLFLRTEIQKILIEKQAITFFSNLGSQINFATEQEIYKLHREHKLYWERAVPAAGIVAQ